MFEDLREESVDVSPDSPDRAIAYAVHARGDAGLTAEEAWAILHERYPDDARFLLLNAYAEIGEPSVGGAWTPGYFLKKLERILEMSAESLRDHVKDVLGFGASVLAKAKGDDAVVLKTLRDKVGAEGDAKRDERAGLRLRRFEREVLRELDERTADGAALGERRAGTPAAPSATDWAAAVADASRPKKPYSAAVALERGDIVEHSKFGRGVVVQLEPGRANILFESGPRKLVVGS